MMIYEVSYICGVDELGEPEFCYEYFKNKDKAWKLMIKKQNKAPCITIINPKYNNLIIKEVIK